MQKIDRRIQKRESFTPHISYPSELPIASRTDEIRKMIASSQVVIVSGSTGSGKTTQLPKILLECGYGKTGRIGCTQPRRLAASGMAKRVADEMKCAYGREVGCKVRFHDNTDDSTVVKFMTDGILLAETAGDRFLQQYDSLIIDEAHERSLNIDFILGYLKTILPKRPELKVVISSATLNTEAFSRFFNNAPIIEIEGRMYPIEDIYMPPLDEDEDTPSHVLRAIEEINSIDSEGDVLVFLPGEKEIRDSADLLSGQNWKGTEILPLYGRLSMSEQQQVFCPGGRRRIILSTNVAETSITIPGIHYVVDTGLVRISRYEPRSRIQSLQVEQVSKASAMQRRGRCGRITEGICVHLYSRETLDSSPDYTDPEICRTSLAEVILQMMVLNLPEIDKFPLIDSPAGVLIREGYKTLYEIGAIDDHRRITKTGWLISEFPIDPRLAKMVCRGNIEKSLNEMVVVASFLSLQDPRERPLSNQTAADNAHKKWFDENSDFISILKLWNHLENERRAGASNSRLKKLCRDGFVNYRRIKEWQNLYAEIAEITDTMRWRRHPEHTAKELYDYASIHRCVISAFPSNVGMKTENSLYQGAGDLKFNIFPGSNIFKKLPKWIVSFTIVETTKLYARMAAEISSEWIETVSPHLCRFVYKDIHWQEQRGFVSALETVVFRSLLVHKGRQVHYGRIDVVEARKIFIRDGVVLGRVNTSAVWLSRHEQMLYDIELMETKIRRPESLLDKDAIYRHFDKLIPPDVCSVKALEEWLVRSGKDISMDKLDAIYPLSFPVDWKDYPDKLVFNRHEFKLAYKFDPGELEDGVTLLCPADMLGFLPDYAAGWIIDGWLAEKVQQLIRTLPKEKRILCNPVQQASDEFMQKIRSGAISRNRHLIMALSDFLTQRTGQRISPDDFEYGAIPKYLEMKIGKIQADGKKIDISVGMPDRDAVSSRIRFAEDDYNESSRTGFREWPGSRLDGEVTLDHNSGLKGYPALVDEANSVGVQIFADSREAVSNHRKGLVRLFRIQYREQAASLDKNLPMKRNAVLTLSSIYTSEKYKKDFADAVIYNALTDYGANEVRNSDSFHDRAVSALGSMKRFISEMNSSIETILQNRDDILRQISLLKSYKDNIDDIKVQLNFLFRPGFLANTNFWNRYPSYMKAIFLRIERMKNSPLKDMEKFSQLAVYQKNLDDRFKSLKNHDIAYGTMDFAWMLQEFRIKVFAPEMPLPVKVTAKILDQLWHDTAGDKLKV